MKILGLLNVSILCGLLFSSSLKAEVSYVSSQQEFDEAHDSSTLNDSIIWMSGTYSDIYMDIKKDYLFILAEESGGTIFTGASRVSIEGDYVAFQGFQFLDGDIGTDHIVDIRGSHITFTQINIRGYTSYKYLIVRSYSQYVEISYCNFENRIGGDGQNILSILVDEVNPGYHKIQHCSFKNFDGRGNDEGVEPIRIGLSSQGEFISRTLVEYCYFKQCNGDGEIISSKARQNVYRFNTFEDNPVAELVLRHGSESIVYGNFFLHGKGGVRVKEGQNHYIYNNYFYDLEDRAIYLQNYEVDPLDNINIAFNTIIDCSEVRLGGNGVYKPTNITFSNNIFFNPNDDIFSNPTVTETWIGNISFGDLGMPLPNTGITEIDPLLEENSEGFFGLNQNSPAINTAQSGYAILPQYEGIEDIDTEVLLDIMGQNRPSIIEEKDLGCNEYPHDTLIQPYATEDNTGPIYNQWMSTSLENTVPIKKGFIKINPNPIFDQLNITVHSTSKVNLTIDIFNLEGKKIVAFSEEGILPGKITLSKNIENLPSGLYIVRVNGRNPFGGIERIQTAKFIKSK